jgi:hypothetical protein
MYQKATEDTIAILGSTHVLSFAPELNLFAFLLRLSIQQMLWRLFIRFEPRVQTANKTVYA